MEKNKFEINKSDIPSTETTSEKGSIKHFSDPNPYIVLGISESSSAKEIVSAWKKLLLEYHPDKSKHHQAKEISQYLNRAIRKLVGKDGTLLNYDPGHDIEIGDDEDITDWDFGFPNVSDKEWYAGDKYWEILDEDRQKKRVSGGLEDKDRLQKEKEFVLRLFEEYGDTQENLDNPDFDRTKILFHDTLITADIEDHDFRVVGSRYEIEDGRIENSIDIFHEKENIWRLKERVYNSEGKIVFDGSKMRDPIHSSWEFFENPPFLYHGTTEENIEEFEPRSAIERTDEEPAVYASPDMDIAIQSMANKYVSNGGIVNERKFVCIPMSEEDFLKVDHGGYIYKLPGEFFKPNKHKGFGGDLEWVSATPVKPIEKIKIPSLLESLKEKDIEVYFIDEEMIPVIKKAQNGKSEKLEALLEDLKSKGLKA